MREEFRKLVRSIEKIVIAIVKNCKTLVLEAAKHLYSNHSFKQGVRRGHTVRSECFRSMRKSQQPHCLSVRESHPAGSVQVQKKQVAYLFVKIKFLGVITLR